MKITQRAILLSQFILLPVLLSGCLSTSGQISAQPDTSAQNSAIVEVAEVISSPTPPLPSISVDALREGQGQSLNAYPAQGVTIIDNSELPAPVISTENDSNEPSKPTPLPTEIVPTATVPQTPTPTEPAPTVTPAPTFTLPPEPEGSVGSHFWIKRPIPEGGVVWTDKAYPYGNTKGKSLRTHHGVEFFVQEGTPILAVGDGEVVVAGDDLNAVYGPETNFYGNLVVLKHDMAYQGQPLYTLYGHLSGVTVTVGQMVKMDDVIGYSGATGVADGPHLHFEVRLGSNTYASTRNPVLWLWPYPDYGVLSGTLTFPNGSNAFEAPVKYRRLDVSSSPVKTAYTYADSTVNGDDVWGENFAADDVEAGYYEVFIDIGGERVAQEVWVYPWKTTFVEFVIGENP